MFCCETSVDPDQLPSWKPADQDPHGFPLWLYREHSGSVVECLTRDRGAVGSSLHRHHCVVSLSKTHVSLLSTGSTQEDPSGHN